MFCLLIREAVKYCPSVVDHAMFLFCTDGCVSSFVSDYVSPALTRLRYNRGFGLGYTGCDSMRSLRSRSHRKNSVLSPNFSAILNQLRNLLIALFRSRTLRKKVKIQIDAIFSMCLANQSRESKSTNSSARDESKSQSQVRKLD